MQMDVLRVARSQGKTIAFMGGEDEYTEASMFERALGMPPGIADVVVGVVGVVENEGACLAFTAAGCDRNMGKGVRICSACGTQAVIETKCSGCKLMHYCNQTCQRNHWAAHRDYCRAVSAVHQKSMEMTGKDAKEALETIVNAMR